MGDATDAKVTGDEMHIVLTLKKQQHDFVLIVISYCEKNIHSMMKANMGIQMICF